MLSRSLAERHERLENDGLRDETDDLIPHPAADGVVNRSHPRIAPRECHHRPRAGDPDALVPPQSSFDRGLLLDVAERRAEHDRIFECLRGALASVWQHRMGGITEQRDCPIPPRTDWIAYEQLVEAQILAR